MLSLSEIVIELEALEACFKTSKVRSMIYDVQTKENVAWIKGLSKETFYYMEYSNWIELRNSAFNPASPLPALASRTGPKNKGSLGSL